MARPPRLRPFLDHLWHSDGVIADRRERVLPDGTLGLVLALGDSHRLVEGDDVTLISDASFSGLLSRPFVLDHPARCDTLGIVLRPAGAYAVLAQPLSETSEVILDARDLFGSAVDELIARCADARSVGDRFAHVERWLTERLARSRAPDPAIAWMAAEIERSGGEARIGRLREESGLSRTCVVERFREQIGVRPKLYARLVRFRRTLDRLRAGGMPLAELALDAGYYDQAHMNAEFRELAGISPTEFVAAHYVDGSGNTAREPELGEEGAFARR
jgi:AraC-like DNA-binding protein